MQGNQPWADWQLSKPGSAYLKSARTSKLGNSPDPEVQTITTAASVYFEIRGFPISMEGHALLPAETSSDVKAPYREVDFYGQDESLRERAEHPRGLTRHHYAYLSLVTWIVPWVMTVALLVNMYITSTWGQDRFRQPKLFASQMTYSPAQAEIEYMVRVFDHNLVNSPLEFQDPETMDDAWAALYNAGGSIALSVDEARRIPNDTIGSTDDGPKEYIVQIDVFHQLHCLDMMRLALEPFYGLKNDSLARLQANGGARETKQQPKLRRRDRDERGPWHLIGNVKHLNHCLNTLRQSIMCHSDVSANVWQWKDKDDDGLMDPFGEPRSHSYPFTNVAHTCRNFEKIRDWARSRQMRRRPDFSVQPEPNDFNVPTWP